MNNPGIEALIYISHTTSLYKSKGREIRELIHIPTSQWTAATHS